MKKINDYYLGLDMGTNSVGWAVTDENYEILKFNGKAMWGSRLFDTAETAEERRAFRSARRRNDRKKYRIKLLQELFAEEISKVDFEFYMRLKDSKYYQEDKFSKQINTLFNDDDYTDKDFHDKYASIYHLRKDLIKIKDEEFDVRLIYLAVHHIIKNRGHFLFEGQNLSNIQSFNIIYTELVNYLNDELNIDLGLDNANAIEEVLRNKHMNRSTKAKKIVDIVGTKDKQCKTIIGLLLGLKKKTYDLFVDDTLKDEDIIDICFSDAKYEEENKEKLADILQERFYVIEKIKAVYDWNILVDILQGETYLSDAKCKVYDKHAYDLAILKKLVKTYLPMKYDDIFRKNDKKLKNYVSYSGRYMHNGKRIAIEKTCSQEEFCKYIKKEFEKIFKINNSDEILIYLEEQLSSESPVFMPKQVNKDNGVIPYQVHEQELREILENASRYLLFLNDKDDKGRSVKEKIMMLFRFRIPYYVGPLNDQHASDGANVWVVKKSNERINPWNFDDIVDKEASNERFIKRMTNKCTYIMGEDVIAKNSLVYSEFMLLNEINNIRINNEKIDNELKLSIYNDLFKNVKRSTKVTAKKLCDYFRTKGYDIEVSDLSGFDLEIKASLKSYVDFKKIIGDRVEEHDYKKVIDRIISWILIFTDRTMLQKKIKTEYSDMFSKKEIAEISKLKYKDWARFSEKWS